MLKWKINYWKWYWKYIYELESLAWTAGPQQYSKFLIKITLVIKTTNDKTQQFFDVGNAQAMFYIFFSS